MTDPAPGTNGDELGDTEDYERDSALIGRAFRRSAAAMAAIAVVAFGAWHLLRDRDVETVVDEGPAVTPRVEDRAADLPDVRFVDITADAGIDFVHDNGGAGDKFLPETMGGGAAFFDHDGDGDPDLLLVNGCPWDDRSTGRPSRLYRNDGGRFVDITSEAGIDVVFQGMGVAVGDYDNDGDPDLYLTGVGERHLLEQRDGRYVDVTTAAGVAGDPTDWSTSAAFVDVDGDGWLDLFVCSYVRWSPDIDREIDFQLTGVGRAYGPPTQYRGSHSYLFRNRGDGTFEDRSDAAGIRVENQATGEPVGKALGVLPVDVDMDGHVDLIVANDTVRNFLLHNQGDGTFEEVGAISGIGFDNDGKATGAMGIDAAYFRTADALGVAIGNFANEMSSLYVHQGVDMLFSDEAISEGIGPTSRRMLSFGLFFFDYDLDGRLDLAQANGHLEEEINTVQPSQHYRQPAQLFWNAGTDARRCFVPVEPSSTGDFSRDIVGRAAAYADVDGDGDLDVLFTQIADRPLLLRNDQATGHHFLRIRLVGTRSNRDAIGAWVEATVGGELRRVQCMPTRSYLTQVETIVTLGLGSHAEVDRLEVVWPDGSRQVIDSPVVDGLTVVEQATG